MPPFVVASYARPVTTPTRAARARQPAADSPATPEPHDQHDDSTEAGPAASPRRPRARVGRDPDGGAGDVHELLIAAVDEAARLLEADGAMVYLVDPTTGHLRFAHDAGIRSKRSRQWVRSIDLPVGTGMFGLAVERRSVVLTRDYLADESFFHAEDPDRVVRDIGIRSMVVAPLVAGDEVFGALGTFSSRLDAFSESDIRLVRALADHSAAAMAVQVRTLRLAAGTARHRKRDRSASQAIMMRTPGTQALHGPNRKTAPTAIVQRPGIISTSGWSRLSELPSTSNVPPAQSIIPRI
jgi:hypothetical protein